jgi:hypothetical protein
MTAGWAIKPDAGAEGVFVLDGLAFATDTGIIGAVLITNLVAVYAPEWYEDARHALLGFREA